jgi:hypothetical protein
VNLDNELLQAKRLKLQLKRKVKDRIQSAEYILAKLKDNNVPYKLMMDESTSEDDKDIVEWPFLNFPDSGWGHINWDGVEDKAVLIGDDLESKKKFINKNFNLEGHADVFISWSNALKPTISVKYVDCINMLFDILEEDFDCWIYSIDKGLLIESYHDGGMTFGTINSERN